jgi:pilus assembly protein TadC
MLAVVLFFAVLLALLRYPSGARGKRAGAMERDLPLALRQIAAELSLGAAFEACLEDAAKADYGALSAEFNVALRDVRSGMPLPQALSLLAGRVGSEQLDRAVAHLADCYSSGAGADTLKRLADGLVAEQRAKAKEYNGKFAMYSLFFISASAVVPAVFQALVIVGSSFLDMSITPLQATLVPALAFPALSAAILLVLRWRRPRFL